VPTVLAGKVSGVLNGVTYPGADFKELAYFINVSPQAQTLNIAALANKGYLVHPVHAAAAAADKRAASATYTAATGSFNVPARTAVVFVVN
jgi:pullulanase